MVYLPANWLTHGCDDKVGLIVGVGEAVGVRVGDGVKVGADVGRETNGVNVGVGSIVGAKSISGK